MYKKFTYLVIIFFSLNFIAYGQIPKGIGKSDPDAKKVLDAVSVKFKTFKTMKANFSLKIENAAGKVQGVKTGTVLVKGMKYQVSITGQEIFCDGTNIWTLDKSAKEVQLSTLDNGSGSITPQKLFTNFYDKDFLYYLNSEITKNGKTYQVIELTPIDKTKSFFKVVLEVDKVVKMIMSTRVFEKSGNRYVYTINNFTTNVPMGDDAFVFNAKKFPGVELIDLR